jgi:polyketide cyclase/dehydrase/lipid transport protein
MNVTITEELFIARPPEVVWDYTQDYARRPEWDRSILAASVLENGPRPRIRVRAAGGLRGVFQYKLFERPRRTSVELTEVESALISGGGGSWSYDASGAGTQWTQTNALRFKSRFAYWMFGPLVRWSMRRATRSAMRAAKRFLERDGADHQSIPVRDGAGRRP